MLLQVLQAQLQFCITELFPGQTGSKSREFTYRGWVYSEQKVKIFMLGGLQKMVGVLVVIIHKKNMQPLCNNRNELGGTMLKQAKPKQ